MILIIVLIVAQIPLGITVGRLLRRSAASTSRDVPARVASAALSRLPADRLEWGRAMSAELASVPAGARRRRFALGAVRVALLPPARRAWLPATTVALCFAAAVTLLAHALLPTTQLCTAVTGLLLSARLALALTRRPPARGPRVLESDLVGAVLLVGTACVAAVTAYIAVVHPAAVQGRLHTFFSLLLAIIVTGYVTMALAPPRRGRADWVALRWGAGGGGVCASSWILSALTRGSVTDNQVPYPWLAALAVIVLTAAAAGAHARSGRAGLYTGLWAGLINALAAFLTVMITDLAAGRYTLTDAHDIAAYRRGGAPDGATFIIGDDFGGLVMMLAWFPVIALVLGRVGGAIGTRLRLRARARHSSSPRM